MNTQSTGILTASERVREQKFTAGMDKETAYAIRRLFEITKPGCCKYAYELFEKAHFGGEVSRGAISLFVTDGIVNANGSIPTGVKCAIKRAVAEGYLEMHTDFSCDLKPEPTYH